MLELWEKNTESEFFLFLANMHTFTKLQDWNQVKQNTINIIKIYLSCGIDPNKYLIYNPADIPWHVQLGRVLTCLTHMGHMERMHAYKDAVQKWKANETSVWTFCYPILMASDILLYDADFVPVWKDQKQHVEYARDIAQKFNNMYWETFNLPEPYIQESVATIPWIDGQKMSKSYDNFIGILDDEKTVSKRIKQISTNTIPVEDSKNPDECNVYKILKLFLNEKEDLEIRKKYLSGWLSYKYAKDILFEKVISFLNPIQKKFKNISDEEVTKLIQKNWEIANKISETKIKEVYKKVWFSL